MCEIRGFSNECDSIFIVVFDIQEFDAVYFGIIKTCVFFVEFMCDVFDIVNLIRKIAVRNRMR